MTQYYDPTYMNNYDFKNVTRTWNENGSVITYTEPVQQNHTFINTSDKFVTMRSDGSVTSFDIEKCIESANDFKTSKTPTNAIGNTIIQIIAMLEKICKDDGLDINEQIMKLKWK